MGKINTQHRAVGNVQDVPAHYHDFGIAILPWHLNGQRAARRAADYERVVRAALAANDLRIGAKSEIAIRRLFTVALLANQLAEHFHRAGELVNGWGDGVQRALCGGFVLVYGRITWGRTR